MCDIIESNSVFMCKYTFSLIIPVCECVCECVCKCTQKAGVGAQTVDRRLFCGKAGA